MAWAASNPLVSHHGVNAAGESYSAVPAPGGTYHVYADGRRIFVAAHQAPAAPAVAPAAAAPGADPAVAVGDYRDSGYFGDVANAQATRDAALGASQATAAQNLATKQAALSALSSQPQDEQNLKNQANAQGLFYSGSLGQGLGDLAAKYTAARLAATNTYTNAENARIAGDAGTNAAYGTAVGTAGEAAVGRSITADQAAATAGALAQNPTLPAVHTVTSPAQVKPTAKKVAPKTFSV